jgi:hypothetical protein
MTRTPRDVLQWTDKVFSAQADWTLTDASHKETEQSTIEASVTRDGVTLTSPLIRRSPSVCGEIAMSVLMFWTSSKPAK